MLTFSPFFRGAILHPKLRKISTDAYFLVTKNHDFFLIFPEKINEVFHHQDQNDYVNFKIVKLYVHCYSQQRKFRLQKTVFTQKSYINKCFHGKNTEKTIIKLAENFNNNLKRILNLNIFSCISLKKMCICHINIQKMQNCAGKKIIFKECT